MDLIMRAITKSFDSNNVLRKVDFRLSGGEIHALLGENGAGKSTLMNILGGVLRQDSGDVLINGKPVSFAGPKDSLAAGVAFIHQELNLINDLTVYENLFLGREIRTRFGTLDTPRMRAESRRMFERMNIGLDENTMVRGLDASYKQIVEIARAMMTNASIIIMDEPTTSLTEPEIERVFAMMRTLRAQGVGIVFISHKLREVIQIADRYTVLRDGETVATGQVAGVTAADLARFMVGHDVRTDMLTQTRKASRSVLRAERLSGVSFKDISFDLHAGEVLGVTGLLGDGRSELFLSIFGAGEPYSGDLYLEGKPFRLKGSARAGDYGIAYLPRNRKENGIIKDMSAIENGSIVVWPRISRFGFIDKQKQRAMFDEQVKSLRIKMSKPTDMITSLSGGNQQKVVLAKWLSSSPNALILDNPTQGVDVGAKEEIYDIIMNLARQGVAIALLSSETQEIIRVCDRALVMYHGRIAGEVAGETMQEQTIMRLATGDGVL
ncbi:MAG: sugar ABC transporter ATP-binding protein [Oscillospiraceae bacterium]|nr:sugar ABC transporter ATP-binding protein [Oscillospiraceae bacterium]